jgi:hypothetical protein
MHPTEVCQLAIAALTPLLGGVLAASSSGPNSDLRGGWYVSFDCVRVGLQSFVQDTSLRAS